MKKLLFLFSMVLMALMFTECTKEGPRGRPGADGKDGTDGNANVQSYLFTNPTTIEWDASNSIYLYYDTVFAVPDSIRNEGIILIYMQYQETGTAWYFVPGLGPNGLWNTRIWITENYIRIYALNPDGTSYSGTPLFTPVTIRVVLIPPTAATVIARKGNPPNYEDYFAVEEYFGL
ncbi:MAG: hypothetical protein R6V49_06155 [Bacteroidales bacterium]